MMYILYSSTIKIFCFYLFREAQVMKLYDSEITSGPTLSFKAVPCNIQDEIDKTVKQIEGLETNVESIRNKLRTMIVSIQSYRFI